MTVRTDVWAVTWRTMAQSPMMRVAWPYRYAWHKCNRKDQPCKVTARGKMNSCRVEFPDGFKMITSRNALRKWK